MKFNINVEYTDSFGYEHCRDFECYASQLFTSHVEYTAFDNEGISVDLDSIQEAIDNESDYATIDGFEFEDYEVEEIEEALKDNYFTIGKLEDMEFTLEEILANTLATGWGSEWEYSLGDLMGALEPNYYTSFIEWMMEVYSRYCEEDFEEMDYTIEDKKRFAKIYRDNH